MPPKRGRPVRAAEAPVPPAEVSPAVPPASATIVPNTVAPTPIVTSHVDLTETKPTIRQESRRIRSDLTVMTTFGGTPSEDPYAWLAMLDFNINPSGTVNSDEYDDKGDALILVAKFLSGLAKDWFFSLPASLRPTYAAWRILFLEKFATSQTARDTALQTLFNKRQGPQESIHDFVLETSRLCKRANPTMTEAEQINYISSKVYDADLMTVLSSRRPTTVTSLLDYSTEYLSRKAAHAFTQQFVAAVNADHRVAAPQYDTVVERPPGRYARANVTSNTNSADRPPPDNRKCYNCGKTGHISRFCRGPRIGNGFTHKPDPNFR